jgi:hypothetical protein
MMCLIPRFVMPRPEFGKGELGHSRNCSLANKKFVLSRHATIRMRSLESRKRETARIYGLFRGENMIPSTGRIKTPKGDKANPFEALSDC